MANDDYAVGYKKPPKSGRFKPGQSGNPRGRPKGVRALKDDIAAALNSRIKITKNGRETYVSAQQAAIFRVVDSALRGDTRALAQLIKLAQLAAGDTAGPVDSEHLTADDEAIIAHFLQRQKSETSPTKARRASNRRTKS